MNRFLLMIALMSISFMLFSQSPAPGGVKGFSFWNKTKTENSDLNVGYNLKNVSDPNLYNCNYAKLDNTSAYFCNFNRVMTFRNDSDSLPMMSIRGKSDNIINTIISTISYNSTNTKLLTNIWVNDGFLQIDSLEICNNNGGAIGPLKIVSVYGSKNVKNNRTVFKELFNKNIDFVSYDTNSFTTIPETIIYDRYISQSERRRVESYLALKYGILLNGSYLSSKGDLLWDFDKYKNFSNNVRGIINDSISGLFQYRSGIYKHDVSSLRKNYSFYGDNIYNSPSDSLFMNISMGDGTAFENGSYLLWGDNNKDCRLLKSEEYTGLRETSRKWMIHTNAYNNYKKHEDLKWLSTNVHIKKQWKHYTIELDSGYNEVSAITEKILCSKYGYYSFSYNSADISDKLYMGWTLGNNILDRGYGYMINSKGQVFSVENGVVSASSIMQLKDKSKIEIIKNSNHIFIRIDGTAIPFINHVKIKKDFVNKDFRGAVKIIRSIMDLKAKSIINNLRIGGFNNDGCKIEISLSNFKDISISESNKSHLCLIKNNYTDEKVDKDFIPCDEIDINRNVAIFNDIVWDTDKSGCNQFYFGYMEDKVLFHVETYVNNNKTINIKLKPIIFDKTKVYSYELLDNDIVITKGYVAPFIGYIDNVKAGKYDLVIKEYSPIKIPQYDYFGFNYYKIPDNAIISWTHRDITNNSEKNSSHLTIITRLNEKINNSRSSIRMHNSGKDAFGIEVLSGKMYEIYYYLIPESVRRLQNGDRISHIWQNGRISTYSNDEGCTLGTSYSIEEKREMVFSVHNINSIEDLCILGFDESDVVYFTSEGEYKDLHIGKSIGKVVQKSQIDLRNNSYTREVRNNQYQDENITISDNQYPYEIRLFLIDKLTKKYGIDINLETESNVSLMVFDIQGHLVKQKEMMNVRKTTTEISFPYSGFYIVKLFSSRNKEYTKKLMVE